MRLRFIIALMLSGYLADGVSAASFDCLKATSADEIAICNDARLSRSDEEVNNAYEGAKRVGGKKSVNKLARSLLRERRQCGADVECIFRNQTRSMQMFKALSGTSSEDYASASLQPENANRIDLDLAMSDEGYKINAETFKFKLCNNFRTPVNVAVAARADAYSSDLVVRGWFIVPQGGCQELGNFWKGDFLYTAYASDNSGFWGKQERLCVSGSAFEYRYAPGQSCAGGFTMPFTHLFAVRDEEIQTLNP